MLPPLFYCYNKEELSNTCIPLILCLEIQLTCTKSKREKCNYLLRQH